MTVTAPPPVPVADGRAQSGHSGRLRSAFLFTLAEAGVSVFAALLLTWMSRRLHVNPMNRIGQVSGLAGVQLRLLVLLTATVALYLVLSRLLPQAAVRIGAAAVAGLATGVTASGSVISLRGTIWPINGFGGDIGNLQTWAYNVIDGVPLPEEYPPGFPHVLAWIAQLVFDGDPTKAVKWVMVGFLAITGPVAYLAWRMLLPPLWALGVGVTATLPLVDPYKPYSPLVLVVVIPVFAKLVQVVQDAYKLGRGRASLIGASLGLLLAGLFLLYAGWFVWSAVGVVVLFLFVLGSIARKRGLRALGEAALPLAASVAVFLALAGPYMVRLLGASGSTKDTYFYFDTWVDPAYWAMWSASMPTKLQETGWPLPGELGGVGIVPTLLITGMAVAFGLALRKPVVLTLAACTGSAFLLRYWYASHMYQDQVVQLYPRTSIQIMYCMIALTGLALYYSADRIRSWVRTTEVLSGITGRIDAPAGRRTVVIGALCGLALLFGSAGSATSDAFMPKNPEKHRGFGELTWYSHTIQQPDGSCPKYAPGGVCAPFEMPKRPMPQRPGG
ncbi:hypothetical protein OG365_14315 [Streptomyces sp. NBC_00853]|uniref:hypothetical protein n=1 Tax=Streptomyces sp. NBC_00853 TaxID=2903681 RepID=UPI003873C516|nr:hypothetical protein OG365_14315 [Streptomyces sp. NBC_00853]